MKTLYILVCFLTLSFIANGQTINVVAKDSSAAMQKIAEGVYVIIHQDASDEWPHGNTEVVVGDDGILVVDACYLPSRAAADIKLIKGISAKPVKYLVYTHWHMDHNNGGIEYKKAFQQIQIVSERQTADFIETNANWWAKFSLKPEYARIKGDNALQHELDNGKDTVTGKPFTPEQITQKKKVLLQRRSEKQELTTLQVVKPDKVFDGEITLTLGKRKIILKDRGCANSLHDVTIYLPAENILFTGDIAVQTPLPFVGCSYPPTWVKVLNDLINMKARIIVMGHGAVQYNNDYLTLLEKFYSTAVNKATVALAQGESMDDFLKTFNLDEFHTGVWAKSDALPDDDWNQTVQVLATRAWSCLRGQEHQ